ncbi:MAG: acyl carrier protein [Acidaminococcaceae bacterium]|nr:acyl carrier protein [Acidaminococcaceae bacterium]
MDNKKKLELLADTFDCDAEDLKEELALEDLDNWDSMTKLALIVLMDDEYGKTLTSNDIKNFKTVGDVLAYMG